MNEVEWWSKKAIRPSYGVASVSRFSIYLVILPQQLQIESISRGVLSFLFKWSSKSTIFIIIIPQWVQRLCDFYVLVDEFLINFMHFRWMIFHIDNIYSFNTTTSPKALNPHVLLPEFPDFISILILQHSNCRHRLMICIFIKWPFNSNFFIFIPQWVQMRVVAWIPGLHM